VSLTRRDLLRAGGSLTLLSTLGCDRLERMLPVGWRRPELPEGPFAAPSAESVGLVRHVLERLGFGPRPEDYGRLVGLGETEEEIADAFIEEQLQPETLDDPLAEWAVRRLETLDAPPGEFFEYKPRFLLGEMTRGVLLRAVYSRRQLFEVMVHFWTDHFNIDVSKGDCKWLKAVDDREVIRRHALGSFPELLRASATSPAMLWYLDGRVNQLREPDDRPNENYARELLELHTLGVDGGYSQRDVMEVARCLTGWTVRSEERFGKGQVEFHPELHDDGEKEALGHRIPAGLGAGDLDRVIEIAAHHPSTARYLSTKLCRRFIADEPPRAAVDEVAAAFERHRGEIVPTLRALFHTDAFRCERGNQFKRPFHFIASALRTTGARTRGEEIERFLLSMGHAPYQFPTPDGYPQEPGPWLGTLLWRWNFASALAGQRIPGTRVEAEWLTGELGGTEELMAHVLGRWPSPLEIQSFHDSGAGLALLLASPAFQRY